MVDRDADAGKLPRQLVVNFFLHRTEGPLWKSSPVYCHPIIESLRVAEKCGFK
jgi:hypothetical protein